MPTPFTPATGPHPPRTRRSAQAAAYAMALAVLAAFVVVACSADGNGCEQTTLAPVTAARTGAPRTKTRPVGGPRPVAGPTRTTTTNTKTPSPTKRHHTRGNDFDLCDD